MLGKYVDHARNSMRVGVESADCVGIKNWCIVSTRDAKPFLDVATGLLASKRKSGATNGDALAKLTEFMTLELDLQLRLTGKDDLEKLLARCLKVQKQTDFLERGRLQTLSLVDDKDGRLARTVSPHQPTIPA